MGLNGEVGYFKFFLRGVGLLIERGLSRAFAVVQKFTTYNTTNFIEKKPPWQAVRRIFLE